MDFPVTILRPNCPAIFAAAGGGANSFSISGAWAGDSADDLVTMAKSPSAGQLIVVWGVIGNSATDTIAVSDNGTGSWTTFTGFPVSFVNLTCRFYLFWKIAVGNETLISVTRTSGTGRIGLHGAVFTTSLAATEDGMNSATSLSGANPDPGTITKAASGLKLGIVIQDTAGHPTPTLTLAISNTINSFTDSQYDPAAAAGVNSAVWTLGASGYLAAIAGFK